MTSSPIPVLQGVKDRQRILVSPTITGGESSRNSDPHRGSPIANRFMSMKHKRWDELGRRASVVGAPCLWQVPRSPQR